MEFITKAEAIERGLKYFFVGKPCKRGHLAERYLRGTCVQCARDRAKQFKIDNPDADKKDHQKHRASRLIKAKAYREANAEKVSATKKAWYQRNKPAPKPRPVKGANRKSRAEQNLYYVERRKTDVEFKISAYMRNMLGRVLRRTKTAKADKTEAVLGYSPAQLIKEIESKFTEGMTWENYGEWHIDHKTALAVMVGSGETDPAVINALSNLQPLWAADNISKGCKEQ